MTLIRISNRFVVLNKWAQLMLSRLAPAPAYAFHEFAYDVRELKIDVRSKAAKNTLPIIQCCIAMQCSKKILNLVLHNIFFPYFAKLDKKKKFDMLLWIIIYLHALLGVLRIICAFKRYLILYCILKEKNCEMLFCSKTSI